MYQVVLYVGLHMLPFEGSCAPVNDLHIPNRVGCMIFFFCLLFLTCVTLFPPCGHKPQVQPGTLRRSREHIGSETGVSPLECYLKLQIDPHYKDEADSSGR